MHEIRLYISRYNPETDVQPTLKEYSISVVNHRTVLEALLYIYEEIDSTLLFFYGCRYKICGKCAIKINGKPALACDTPLADGMTLEPLDNFPVIRDLGVDRSALMEPLKRNNIVLFAAERSEIVVQPSEFYQLIPCNECLSCLSDCPVFASGIGYDGPLIGVKLAELYYDVRDGKDRLSQLASFLDQCILCKRCEMNCPWEIHFSEISAKIKGAAFDRRRLSIRDWLLSHPPILGKMSGVLYAFGGALKPNSLCRKIIGRLLHIEESVALPAYTATKFRQYNYRCKGAKRKVGYFLGCFEKYNDPTIIHNSLELFARNEVEVKVLDLGCCGLPLIGIGDLEGAKKRAVDISNVLNEMILEGYDIVSSCPSCGLTIKIEYSSLFHQLETPDIQVRLYNMGEYLLKIFNTEQSKLKYKRIEKKVGYHISCHLKAQRIGQPFVDLIRLLFNLEIPVFDKCCGMAGTMGFKKEKADLSRKVGHPLMQEIEKNGLELILSDCAACRMNIMNETNINTLHPVSFLSRAFK